MSTSTEAHENEVHQLDEKDRKLSQQSDQNFSSMILNTKESIYELYRPVIYEIEQNCGNLKNSQMALNRQLEDFFQLLRELKSKLENDKLSQQLDENAKKVIAIRRKLTLIHTIIQNSDDRCKRLIAKYMS